MFIGDVSVCTMGLVMVKSRVTILQGLCLKLYLHLFPLLLAWKGFFHANIGISGQAYKQLSDYHDCTWIRFRITNIRLEIFFIQFFYAIRPLQAPIKKKKNTVTLSAFLYLNKDLRRIQCAVLVKVHFVLQRFRD